MTPERIAISQRITEAPNYAERRDALALDWPNFLNRLFPEAALLPVPNTPAATENWLAAIRPDAVILSNGNDWGSCPDRDRTESILFHRAASMRVPVLGVCRGLHAVNAILGGSIVPDLAKRPDVVAHVATTHAVALVPSPFAAFADERALAVNSFHRHGISAETLAPDLRPFALSEDGLVEGAYHPARPVLAIQWHPERPSPSRHFDAAVLRRFLESGAFWA